MTETVLLALFAVLEAIDGVQTHNGIRRGKLEQNPLARMVITPLGLVPMLLLFKLAAFLIVAGLTYAGHAFAIWPLIVGGSLWLLIPVNLFQAWVVKHNAEVLSSKSNKQSVKGR